MKIILTEEEAMRLNGIKKEMQTVAAYEDVNQLTDQRATLLALADKYFLTREDLARQGFKCVERTRVKSDFAQVP